MWVKYTAFIKPEVGIRDEKQLKEKKKKEKKTS